MKILKTNTMILVSFILSCCTNSGSSVPSERIEGIYTVENMFDVLDPSSGEILGTGKIRDTIFIKSKQNDFEVTNSKWQLNDFDMEGWKNLDVNYFS